MACNDNDSGPTPEPGTYGALDPRPFRQGWDAAAAGKDRGWDNPFHGSLPRAAWEQGYDDFMRERAKAAALPGTEA